MDKAIARVGYFILAISGLFLFLESLYGIDTFRSDLCYTPVKNNLFLYCVVSSLASLLIICGCIFHYQDTSFILNGWFYALTIPLSILLSVLFFIFLQSSKIVSLYDEAWMNGIEEKYVQIHHKCCGWNNFTDRSIEPCPFHYTSGCKNIYSEYFFNRLKVMRTLVITFICFFCSGGITYTSISACCYNSNGAFEM